MRKLSARMNWLTAEMPSIAGGRLVSVMVHIRKNSTGETRKYECAEILMDGESHPSAFCWEDGNYECDCNREAFFDGIVPGKEIETKECTDGRFSVNLENPATGEIYYREF